MDIDQRIAQFENMCQADPDNEMAHFSLGGAYAQADRHEEAAASYRQCLELAPGMSKAYQLAAESLERIGRIDEAGDLADRGYRVAAERGDIMPKDALAELLARLGREVPAVAAAPAAGGTAGASGSFICSRTGRPGTRMDRPPFKGRIGEWIQANISAETFDAWIHQGTKVINELRLDLSRDEDAEAYDRHMYEYLGIDEALLAELGVTGDAS